jgi:hypothetical protein
VEAAAEEMAGTPVAEVEALGVRTVQELHAGGELRLGGFEDEVIVVRHQAEGVHRPLVAAHAAGEQRQEAEPVVVVPVDRAAVDAARRDVEEPIGKRGPEHTRHETNLAPPEAPARDVEGQ